METPNITHQQFYTQIEPNDMLDDLNMERIGSGPPDNLPQYKMDIYQYLNDISDLVRGELVQNTGHSSPLKLDYKIEFIPMGDNTPGNHLTNSQCKPIIVAFKRLDNVDSPSPANLNWSNLVFVGQKLSKGTTLADSDVQGAAYSECLLQARPDFISVPSLHFSDQAFHISLTNAFGFWFTEAIPWPAPSNSNHKHFTNSKLLLYALINRLYIPDLDHRITVHDTDRVPTFDVETGGGVYAGAKLLETGHAIGRRTTVWLSSDESYVIKEQYVEVGRRFGEGSMLDKIHKGGSFPGVVRAIHHGFALSKGEMIVLLHPEGSSSSNKRKVELVLQDKGESLMTVSTPREFLMALYDLLEVTRMLWRKYRILHRDISDNNILIREKAFIPDDPLEIPDMCFSAHLLGEMKKAKGDSTKPLPKLATRIILIDFDMSEDQRGTNVSTERTGTALFMARFVHSAKYPTGTYALPVMPGLDSECHDAYKNSVGDRLDRFPEINKEIIRINRSMESPKPEETFRHKLRYDAESIFWLFLWWAIHAQPPGLKEEIKFGCWLNLTSDAHARDACFIFRFHSDILHSSYTPLEKLLEGMTRHLQGDLEFATGQYRKDEEYVHEAFQRLILKFLFENDGEGFMDLAKDRVDRVVARYRGMSSKMTSSEEEF